MSKIEKLKEFIESIPQFLSDLEPGHPYLVIDGFPEYIWKSLQGFQVIETNDGSGFSCFGMLAPTLAELIPLPEFINFERGFDNGDYIDSHAAYDAYLKEHPTIWSEFNLEEFIHTFDDFYLEFLNESGISEGEVDILGNTIYLLDYSDETETDESEDVQEETGSVDVISDEDADPIEE